MKQVSAKMQKCFARNRKRFLRRDLNFVYIYNLAKAVKPSCDVQLDIGIHSVYYQQSRQYQLIPV